MRKIGFDYHGVLNIEDDKFRDLAKTLVQAGHEVHVLTGLPERRWNDDTRGLLIRDVHYTHFFSVSDYLGDLDAPNIGTTDNPMYDDLSWNSAKGEYAFYNNLTEHYDDTAEYAKYFPSECKFHLVENGDLV